MIPNLLNNKIIFIESIQFQVLLQHKDSVTGVGSSFGVQIRSTSAGSFVL